MFSVRKNSERDGNSELSSLKTSLTLNLSVQGSTAPIYAPTPRTVRTTGERPSKKPKRKEFPFPVDKIIYLSERLELTSLTESISLSTLDTEAESRIEKDVCSDQGHQGFSLDLSSISNTGDEPEESSRCSSESCRGKNDDVKPIVRRSSRGSTAKPKPSDLINVYVSSVKNQNLIKYLRPCRTCEEPCCVCPESPSKNDSVTQCLTNLGDAASGFDKTEEICTECKCLCCPPAFRKTFCPECFEAEPEPDGFRSDHSDRMTNYTSSLANAARSARVLARDLEVILSTLSKEH